MSITPEQLEIALPMVARGLPYGAVANAIGVNRATLYDHLSRECLLEPRHVIGGYSTDVSTYYRLPYIPNGTEAVEITQEVAASRPVHWLERGPGQCKWPIGDGMHLKSCCAQVRRRSPYCEAHHEISLLYKAA